MYISETIAEWVSATETLTPSAVEATRRCILDAVASAVAGQGTPAGMAARNGAVAAWGTGPVPIWLSLSGSTEIGASFANSAAA